MASSPGGGGGDPAQSRKAEAMRQKLKMARELLEDLLWERDETEQAQAAELQEWDERFADGDVETDALQAELTQLQEELRELEEEESCGVDPEHLGGLEEVRRLQREVMEAEAQHKETLSSLAHLKDEEEVPTPPRTPPRSPTLGANSPKLAAAKALVDDPEDLQDKAWFSTNAPKSPSKSRLELANSPRKQAAVERSNPDANTRLRRPAGRSLSMEADHERSGILDNPAPVYRPQSTQEHPQSTVVSSAQQYRQSRSARRLVDSDSDSDDPYKDILC